MMRELSVNEIEQVSGGWTGYGQAATVGGVAGFMNAAANGARFGVALGPKGALGGALIATTAYSAGRFFWH